MWFASLSRVFPLVLYSQLAVSSYLIKLIVITSRSIKVFIMALAEYNHATHLLNVEFFDILLFQVDIRVAFFLLFNHIVHVVFICFLFFLFYNLHILMKGWGCWIIRIWLLWVGYGVNVNCFSILFVYFRNNVL